MAGQKERGGNMANINVNIGDLTDPDAPVIKYAGECYKRLTVNSDTPDTTPGEEFSSCVCCETLSVEYMPCEGSASPIYVDPDALSTMNPPPSVVEIEGVCYSEPICTEGSSAPDTFTITSEPSSCADAACQEPASTCPNGDPEMVLTVSAPGGSTKEIYWTTATWTLPDDNNKSITVCPNVYDKCGGPGNNCGYYTGIYTTPVGFHRWQYGLGLQLTRMYKSQSFRFNRLGINGITTLNGTSYIRGYSSSYIFSPGPTFSVTGWVGYWGGTFTSGVVGANVVPNVPLPTSNNYYLDAYIESDFSGSITTNDNYTFTWAKGNGW